jgi:hypothetical protein
MTRQHDQVVAEDDPADGGAEVLEPLVEAPEHPERALEEGDRAFDAGTKRLRDLEQRVGLHGDVFFVSVASMADRDHVNLARNATIVSVWW